MNEHNLSGGFPVIHPAAPRLKIIRAGQTWQAKLPGQHELAAVEIDEVTPLTVSLRKRSDLGEMASPAEPAVRYKRADVDFVEKVPE